MKFGGHQEKIMKFGGHKKKDVFAGFQCIFFFFLAKHRVTSDYLVAKFGVDTAENEPRKE